jgi:hypothetical protein
MKILTSNKYKFNLCTIEKCACTTMRTWFVCIKTSQDFNQFRDKIFPDIHERVQSYSDKFNEDYYSFAVVRNPYSRLVSTYLDKISNKNNRLYYNRNIKSFKDWILTLNRKGKLKFDIHWLPMYVGLENIKFDKICKLESLQKDIDFVCDRLEIKKYKIHRNKKTMSFPKKPFCEYYDSETVEIVKNIYSKDFEMFGYSKELKHEK